MNAPPQPRQARTAARQARDFAPDRAADRQRAEIDGEEHGEAAPAHPFGQRHLHRHEQDRDQRIQAAPRGSWPRTRRTGSRAAANITVRADRAERAERGERSASKRSFSQSRE